MPIFAATGTNGAGKSSIVESMMLAADAEYFNPDRLARDLLDENSELSLEQANVIVWREMVRQLERAIDTRATFVFETTLGGSTIRRALERAIAEGVPVHIWYAGLDNVELHIARVAARVAAGGHPIPEARIRERYVNGPLNLLRLMPGLSYLKVVDNSPEVDPGEKIDPLVVLESEHGRTRFALGESRAPSWTLPILALARALDM